LVQTARAGLPCILALGLLVVLGCGLASYQSEMEKQQKRIAYLDDANKYLGAAPLSLPDPNPNDKDMRMQELFIRPPLGIAANPKSEGLGMLSRYLPANRATGNVQEVLLAAIRGASDTFKQDVLTVLGMSGSPKIKDVPLNPENTVRCEMYQAEAGDQKTYLFFCQRPPYQMAIAFKFATGAPTGGVNTDTVIDYSLSTLLMGGPAIQKRGMVRAMPPSEAKAAVPR
jgi:hypothetical protein